MAIRRRETSGMKCPFCNEDAMVLVKSMYHHPSIDIKVYCKSCCVRTTIHNYYRAKNDSDSLTNLQPE